MFQRIAPAAFIALLAVAALPAQDLHRALADADLVAVARQIGKQDISADLVVHKVQIVAGVRGVPTGVTVVNVLDWPNLSVHHRPSPRQQRLYCLQDATNAARRAGLPADQGPWYRMVGWADSNPLIAGAIEQDPIVRFARLLASAETGADATATASALADLAAQGAPAVRTEAAKLLAERPDLRTRLSSVHWSRLLSCVTGELEDVPHKIALAELCAEQRLPDLAEALLVGAGSVHHVDYLRAVGRLTANLQGDAATPVLMERLQQARAPEQRKALLLVLGATQTDSALDALLNLRRSLGNKDEALEAALTEHKSRRAREAVLQGKNDGK